MDNVFDNAKIAIGIRAARAAAGWNQQEFATRMGVAKSTVARIETLEMAARGDFVIKAIRLFKDAGIDMDLSDEKELPFRISELGINSAINALSDESNRRSDRKSVAATRIPDNDS
jgi:transcriptional regulator with XRE-family HTH domain